MHLCYVKLLVHSGMNIIMKANTCTEHSCFLWILALECHSKLAGPKTTLINTVSNCKRKVDLKIQIAIHYSDIIMSAMASEITRPAIVCLGAYSGADWRKRQSFASLAIARGIHRWPVNSPHKGPVTRKMFPFDDVIMWNQAHVTGARQTCRLLSWNHFYLPEWRFT